MYVFDTGHWSWGGGNPWGWAGDVDWHQLQASSITKLFLRDRNGSQWKSPSGATGRKLVVGGSWGLEMVWRGDIRKGGGMKEKEEETDKAGESQMTITLLTRIQHQLSISLPLWEKNPPIIGDTDPHPASKGCLANAWLATVTRLSKRSGNTRALGCFGNKWPWYSACMHVLFRRKKDKGFFSVKLLSWDRRDGETKMDGSKNERGEMKGKKDWDRVEIKEKVRTSCRGWAAIKAGTVRRWSEETIAEKWQIREKRSENRLETQEETMEVCCLSLLECVHVDN